MDQPETLILQLLRSCQGPLTFEQMIAHLPQLTWNQIFLTVDRMSRQGHLMLRRRGYEYEVRAQGHVHDLTVV